MPERRCGVSGLIVVGAGPGLGLSVARRFAAEGLHVSLIARRRSTLASVQAEVEASGATVSAYTADVALTDQLTTAIGTAVADNGVPDVVVYNAGLIRADGPADLSAAQQSHAWSVNVLGALTTATSTLPGMVARGGGTFLVTGGLPVPVASHFSLSLGKAALRAMTVMLAEYYGPLGVHAATVTIGGEVAPGTRFDPGLIAERYWRLHAEPPMSWTTEYVFDGTE